MGITPSALWEMTEREFYHKMKGFFDAKYYEQQQAWERERWSTCILLNIQIDSKHRITPRELIEFEWEKKIKETVPLTKAELERIKKLYK